MKTIPTVNDYAVHIWYSARKGDECFVAQVLGWPSIMAHGDTHEEAAREIRDALALALEVSLKYGNPIPEPQRATITTPALLARLGHGVKSRVKLAATRKSRALAAA